MLDCFKLDISTTGTHNFITIGFNHTIPTELKNMGTQLMNVERRFSCVGSPC